MLRVPGPAATSMSLHSAKRPTSSLQQRARPANLSTCSSRRRSRRHSTKASTQSREASSTSSFEVATRCGRGTFGSGPSPSLSAMTLLRLVSRTTLARDVRLFEGFGAFEWAGAPGEEVVLALWAAVRGRNRQHIRGPEALVAGEDNILLPAFTIDGGRLRHSAGHHGLAITVRSRATAAHRPC